jgi:hypothetical protein
MAVVVVAAARGAAVAELPLLLLLAAAVLEVVTFTLTAGALRVAARVVATFFTATLVTRRAAGFLVALAALFSTAEVVM